MPTSVFSNFYGNLGLVAVNAGDVYLALHLTDPGAAGDPATELAGGEYIRRLLDLSNPAGRTQVNRNGVRFHGLPESTIAWLAGWDAITAGNMRWRKQLTPPIEVDESGLFIVEKGDIAIAA